MSLQIKLLVEKAWVFPSACANSTLCFAGTGNSSVRAVLDHATGSYGFLVIVVTLDLLGNNSKDQWLYFQLFTTGKPLVTREVFSLISLHSLATDVRLSRKVWKPDSEKDM